LPDFENKTQGFYIISLPNFVSLSLSYLAGKILPDLDIELPALEITDFSLETD
jgi:hypothetical protein